MRHKGLLVGFICLLLLVFALPVLAEETGGKVQIGSDVYINAGQRVHGDSVAIFGSQRIDGDVDGTVVTIFGDLELSGTINDDVVTIFGKVTLHDGAKIKGDLVNIMGEIVREGTVYVGGEQTSVDMGQIGDEIPRNVHFNFRGFNFWRFPFFNMFRWNNLVFTLLITLIVAYFFMSKVQVLADVIEHDVIRTGLKGLVGTIGIIIGVVLLGITIIGIPVAMILGMIAWIAVSFGEVAVYYLIGDRLAQQLQWETTNLAKALVGALLIGLIAMLPLGGLVKFVIGWLGLGAVLDTKFGTRRPWVE